MERMSASSSPNRSPSREVTISEGTERVAI